MHSAMLRAFHKTDQEYLALAKENGYQSGSTVTLALLSDNLLRIANVGDSQAFLFSKTNNTSACVTKLHTPLDTAEQHRILESGGRLFPRDGVWRVEGQLA